MSSEKTLSREQLLAQKFDRHLAITANAGSGKTTVLEQRYINILLYGNCNKDPRKIIAITFTRKAAAEIRSRIAANLEQRIKSSQHLSEQIFLEKIRAQISNAPIATIHAFCSSLLRDYPIESGIPPNFSELKEVEKINIINNSILITLEEWLEDKAGDKYRKARELFEMFGRDKIRQILFTIIAKRERLPALQKFYSHHDSQTFSDIRNEYIYKKFLQPYTPVIDKLFQLAKQTGIELNYEILSSVQNNSQETFSIEQYFINLKIAFDNLITSKILTKELLINKTTRKKLIKLNSLSGDDFDSVDSLNTQLKILYDIASSYENSEEDKELFRYSKYFLEIIEDVLNTMEDEKQAVSGIDFDDMLIKTMELLNNDDVAEKVRSKYNYLMVDEFQDTNGLQYDIIKKLIPELDSSVNINKTNFFIVGDEKQSIYGFRNADVRVFNKAKEDIYNTNKRLEKEGIIKIEDDKELCEIEKYGKIQIPVSYRLKPVPASFVNRLFDEIMCNEKPDNDNSLHPQMSGYDVDYSEFVCSRDIEELINFGNGSKDIDVSNTSGLGTVSLLVNTLPKKTKEQSDEEAEENPGESVMLSRFLIDMVNSKENDMKWSDITILGRKRAGFNELTKAFRKHEIPYILHTGSGFYNSQEIIDICSILRFLYNNDDNISSAAILRSPFFKIPDKLLYEISGQKNGLSLWKKFKIFCDEFNEPEGINKSLCTRAKRIIEELIAVSARVPIAILIQKILELTGWYAATSNETGVNQIKANIEKLIEYARTFEEQGFRNIFDFVEELNLTIDSEINEGEAVYLTGENAVNIMTIHAAKGLDFPVVCLYNADSTTQTKDSLFISDELGLAFKQPVISEEGIVTVIDTPLSKIAYLENKLKDDAEEKRVLYVALTRAKDRLIISGNIAETKDGFSAKGFLKMITGGLGITPDELLLRSEIVFQDKLKILNNGKIEEISLKYPFRIYKNSDISIHEIVHEIETEDFPEPLVLVDEISSTPESEMFSATKLMVYENNNEEYVRRYLFGLPSIDDDEFIGDVDSADNEDEKLIGTLAGTLIHSVLENIKSWLDSDGITDKNALIETIDEIVLNTEQTINPNLLKRIIDECFSVASTYFVSSNAKNIRDAKFEYELQIPFDRDFLMAKIDMLIRNSEEEWEIWDWKTNRIENHEIFKKLIEDYTLQMQVYSYFVYMLYPEQNYYNARLLFTRKAKDAKKDEDWIYTYSWSREEVIGFEELFKNTMSKIANQIL